VDGTPSRSEFNIADADTITQKRFEKTNTIMWEANWHPQFPQNPMPEGLTAMSRPILHHAETFSGSDDVQTSRVPPIHHYNFWGSRGGVVDIRCCGERSG